MAKTGQHVAAENAQFIVWLSRINASELRCESLMQIAHRKGYTGASHAVTVSYPGNGPKNPLPVARDQATLPSSSPRTCNIG